MSRQAVDRRIALLGDAATGDDLLAGQIQPETADGEPFRALSEADSLVDRFALDSLGRDSQRSKNKAS